MDEFPTDFITIGTVEYVYTTHVIHQEQFYVHLDTRSSILEEIMDALETRYSQLGPNDKTLPHIKLGGLCAAKFTDDNNWYRVKITGLLNSGLIEVNFVDYGNTDYVSADRVKKLDPDLMQYPVQSYRCALAGVSCKHGLWTPELRVQFEDLVIDKRCKASFSGKTKDDVYLLDMYDEEGNYINKMFGATEKQNSAKVNGNSTAQGFESVSWREGQKVQAVVVYVTNPEEFWCQEVIHTNSIIILSEELSRLHMTQEMGPLQDVRPGSICAAKFHEDDAWYRGIIQTVSGNKSQVYFVDYGNTESVELESLCELKPEFRLLPALAVKCSLASLDRDLGNSWSRGVVEEFEKLVVDREFEVNVMRKKHDGFEVSLLDIEENKDVGSQLKQAVNQRGVKAKTPPKTVNINNNSQSQPMGRGLDLPIGSSCNVFLSWVENPADFWVQQEDLSDILDKLSSELQEYYAQPRPVALSSPGAFVIARFSDDQQWYRGLVVKDIDDRVKVLFIDYGNADIIPKSELRQVNPQFGQIDPLAFRCSLKGVKPLPQSNAWSVDAKEFLETLTENGCQCEVLYKNDVHRIVALNVNGKDVAQELVALAVVAGSEPSQVKANIPCYSNSPRLQQNQTEEAMVTHIDSPDSFWVQLNKHQSELDDLMEKLDSHYSEDGGTPVPKPMLKQACVAQYSEDNAWYRAVITNVSPSGYDVHFVDYGNREVVAPSLVCVAEPRFLDLPSQAIRCRLSLSGDVSHLKDNLSDLVLEKDVTLKVISAGEIPTVDLITEGKQSVCTMLKNQSGNVSQGGGNTPLMKPAKAVPSGSSVTAYVSMVHSPDRYFLQLAGIDEELSALMERLAQHYVPQSIPAISQASVGMHCVALYEEDEQWYRGRVTSVQGNQSQVLFVDYGNEELISNEQIKPMIPEVAMTPILAYECSLHGVQPQTWSESVITYFDSLVTDQELTCTFVSKSSVTVLCNGEDVATKLISAGHCQPAGGSGPKSPLSVSTTQAGFGSRSPKSPGFGQSPMKDQSSPRGFGNTRGEGRSFGDSKKGFGGSRQEDRGFGEGREESRGFGGGRKEERGGRFGGGGEGGFNRGDDGSDRSGFKPRSREGDAGGFGKRDGNSGSFGERGSGFGGGKRERNTSSASTNSTNDKFTYADPPSEAESAILVHIDDDGTFYLQLPSMEKDIVFLSKRLAGSYKSGGPRLKETAEKGTICCCKFPDDGSMYRCQVEAVDGNKVLVRYMDYGNIAEHTTFDLKFLFPDLLQYPAQAFPCKLRGLEWSLDKADKFGSATLDKDLDVTFTSTNPPYEVDIKTPDGDLLAIMTGQIIPPAPKIATSSKTSPSQAGGFGSKSPKGFGSRGLDTSTPKKSDMTVKRSLNLSSSPPKPSVPNQIFATQAAPGESQTAFISHISEDGYFYLQLERDTALLDTLTGKLTNVNSSIPHPGLTKGAACAAVFSEDSSWYRALISDIESDQFIVTFVDFGNGDKVSKEKICPLNEDLLSSAPLAYQCRFAEEEEALSDTSKTKLEEYLMEHQLTVSFSSQSAPFAVTATTSDGQDLHEIVCPSNKFRSQVIPKEVTPVGVCHIENDGRFFACFFKKYKMKDDLQKRLQNHFSSSAESLENPEVDMPCCAKCSSDDLWYRCKINSITDTKAEILYVDNGKTESIDLTDLKVLPRDYLKDAPFALECRLKGVESWIDDLKEKFIDMTQDKILNATFFSTSPPFRVSLARSIELDLLGLNAPQPDSPKKAVDESVILKATAKRSAVFNGGDSYITEITPEGTFFVQLVSEEEQLQGLSDSIDVLMEASQDEPDSVEVGKVFFAKFTEDEVWYRAITETSEDDKYTVRFVDYGNTDTVGKDRLAILPVELSTDSIPAFAYKCKLVEDIPNVESFKTAVLDKMVTTEVVEVDGGDVFHVHVKIDGQPVMQNEEPAVFTEHEQQDCKVSSSSERKTVTVSFVINPGQFYVQLQSDEAPLDTMMNELYEEITGLAEGEGLVDDALSEGDLCAALYEDSWYRVRVVSFGEDETVQVLYIDHGNTETVSNKSELRVLSPSYKSLPLYGHEASLPGIKPVSENWTEEAIEAFRSLVEEKSLVADLIRKSDDDPWVVQLLDMGTPVQDTLIAKGFGVATENVTISKSTKRVFSDANESVMVTSEETSKSWRNRIGRISDTLEELKQVTAFVSHCDNPSQIWCQLASSTDHLEELADKLETAYSSIQDSDKIVDLKIDDLVIGLFEDDGMRYRSVVLNSETSGESDKLSLRFIDYGNCGSCSKDQILNIKDELCQQPALAFCCCLDKVQPVEGVWSPEACNRCSELVADQEVLLTLVGRKQDGTLLVDLILQESSKSISDILVEEGLVKKLEMDSSLPVKNDKGDMSECLEITQPIMESTAMVDEVSTNFHSYTVVDAIDGCYKSIELSLHSSYDIIVSDDEMPNAFCVQLKEMSGQYNALVKDIAEHIANSDGGDYSPVIGNPCLVLYESAWYRGLIRMETNGEDYVVVSVDCGWEVGVTSDKLRSIPSQFLELPTQAIHCYLAGVVSQEPEWSAEAITFFTEFIQDHNELHINVLESAEEGKYGVSLTEMQDSSSEFCPSLNSLFVEMCFAETVPGSNIDFQLDMDKAIDTGILSELEQSFKEVEMTKDPYDKNGADLTASSQGDTFVSTREEEQEKCKKPLEERSRFYQLVHLSETDGHSLTDRRDTTQEMNSNQMVLTKKDMAFNIASAVDRIDQMGCIDLFPESSLTFDLTSDADSMFEVSKENKGLTAGNEDVNTSAEVLDDKKTNVKTDVDGPGVEDRFKSVSSKGSNRSPLYTWSRSQSQSDKNDSSTSLDKTPVIDDNDDDKEQVKTPVAVKETNTDKLKNASVNEASNITVNPEMNGCANKKVENKECNFEQKKEIENKLENGEKLTIEEEEKVLLPYEYYETSLVDTVKADNKKVESHPSNLDTDRRVVLQMSENFDKSLNNEYKLCDMGHEPCYNTQDQKDCIDVDTKVDKTVCSANGNLNMRNADAEVFMNDNLEESYNEDSYITLDQTGYDDDINGKDDLTDGYHGSASEEVSSPCFEKSGQSLCMVEQTVSVSCRMEDGQQYHEDKINSGEKATEGTKDLEVNNSDPSIVTKDISDTKHCPVSNETAEKAQNFENNDEIVEDRHLNQFKINEGSTDLESVKTNNFCCEQIKGAKAVHKEVICESQINVSDKEITNASFVSDSQFCAKDNDKDKSENNDHKGEVSVNEEGKQAQKVDEKDVDTNVKTGGGTGLNESGGVNPDINLEVPTKPDVASLENKTLDGSVSSNQLEKVSSGDERKENHNSLLEEPSVVDDQAILSEEKEKMVMTSDEEEDELLAFVSSLDDTDNYESASENFEECDRTNNSLNDSSQPINEMPERYLYYSDSSLDKSGIDRLVIDADSSSYDTSSLVFSDSQFESSYADTSTSTQTTELSGIASDIDTSSTAYICDASSTYEESSLTYENSSSSFDSISSLVDKSSNEKIKVISSKITDISVNEADKEVKGDEDPHVSQTALTETKRNTATLNSTSTEKVTVPCNSEGEIIAVEHGEYSSADVDFNVDHGSNQEKIVSENGPVKDFVEIAKSALENDSLSDTKQARDQAGEKIESVMHLKLDSDQSGPPSFHSADDEATEEETEVIESTQDKDSETTCKEKEVSGDDEDLSSDVEDKQDDGFEEPPTTDAQEEGEAQTKRSDSETVSEESDAEDTDVEEDGAQSKTSEILGKSNEESVDKEDKASDDIDKVESTAEDIKSEEEVETTPEEAASKEAKDSEEA